MIFDAVDIIHVKDSIGITATGESYALAYPFDIEILILHALAKQLKITGPAIGYAKVDNQFCLVQALDEPLEYWDESVRFQFDQKTLLNIKDLVLYTALMEKSGRGVVIEDLAIKFGKKHVLYFPLIETSTAKTNEIAKRLNVYLAALKPQQVADLNQRFWVLLNDTYLNKLRTYIAFWLKSNEISCEWPDWFNKLFTENELEKTI